MWGLLKKGSAPWRINSEIPNINEIRPVVHAKARNISICSYTVTEADRRILHRGGWELITCKYVKMWNTIAIFSYNVHQNVKIKFPEQKLLLFLTHYNIKFQDDAWNGASVVPASLFRAPMLALLSLSVSTLWYDDRSVGKDLEGSGHGLTEVLSHHLLGGRGKSRKPLVPHRPM
jgi:hypothetical protein